MNDSKIVIKINYDPLKQKKEIIDPKYVTVWHVRRIIVAAGVSLAILLAIGYCLLGKEQAETAPSSIVTESAVNSVAPVTESPQIAQTEQASHFELANNKSPAIIYDKRVVRAALVKQVTDGQPGDSAGINIRINGGKNLQLFYFSQVKAMKGDVLFHHWLKDGHIVLKKRLSIRDNKAKLVSSKIFTDKDLGIWQVILVDQKGKLFSETNFAVNQ